MELQKLENEQARSPGVVLTKAVVRAAEHLKLPSATLAKVLGLSPPTITRMRKGQYVLSENEKPFELAALFIRLYRSLDGIVGGDSAVAAQWMQSMNTALGERPVNLIQKVVGLINVLRYLDSRRAVS